VSTPPTVDELVVADRAGSWQDAGFRVDGDLVAVGSVRIRLAGPGDQRGILSWSLRDTATLELDGLATSASERAPAAGAPHPNGVVSVDHLVVMTPVLDRTVAVLEAAGFDLRRRREGPTPGGSLRQAFFRMAELILELVEAPAGRGWRPTPTARRGCGGSPFSSRTCRPRRALSAPSSEVRARRFSPAA
jgi:hypothetical protein